MAGEVSLSITATTPNRQDEPVEDASGSVTVLTRPEIEAQRPITAPEVLKDLPGVSLQEDGTMGESATLTLRGTEPTQTLILMDGIRLNSPFRGGFDLGNLMMDQIEQVEVVRGAQSALYGSDAMGGVVNLRTQRGRGPLELSFIDAVGSEGTFREALSANERRSLIDYSLTFSRTDSHGQFDRDRFGGSTFAGQVGLTVRNTGHLELINRLQDDRKELATDIVPIGPDTVQAVSDQNDEIRRRLFFHSVQYQDRFGPRLDIDWKAAMVRTNLNWDNPADLSTHHIYFEDTDARTFVLDLQQNIIVSDTDSLSFGVERVRDIVNSEILEHLEMPDGGGVIIIDSSSQIDKSRQNTAYYLQNLFRWEKQLVLQAGVRVDDYESFGAVTNPKVSSAYEWSSTGTKLRASWGRGFRAPTIQELFFPNFGNLDLKPERSQSWEVGIQQPVFGEILAIDTALFWIDYDNLIQFSPTGVDNIGKARTRGVESGLKIHPIPTLILKTNYTYLDAKDRASGDELPFRPRHQGNISFLYTPTVNLIATLDINMVSSQSLWADFILRDGSLVHGRSPGYTRVDLSATYHLFGNLLNLRETLFFLKVLNLFNREYQEVPGFPSPGVSFLAGVTATL